MTPDTKNKLKLAFLLLITVLPVTLATLSFNSAIENGDIGGSRNKGTLILPPADISALMMSDAQGQPVFRSFEEEIAGIEDEDEYQIKPWLMVFVTGKACDDACKDRIHYLKQLHIALGKNIQRVRRYYLDASPQPLSDDIATLFREEYPSMGIAYTDKNVLESNLRAAGVDLSLADRNYVLLVDPVGNVMMYYTDEQSAEDIMTDLETLLKYSSLG
ncbi:MAG: hypothetical protein KDI28_06235 [Pseudomonadales bacterium]|nr:hypothetical protein [Pseudomonadales bacterium]MCP5357787.1 hypothetical protein [Pseudomonadales bacterium]